MASKPEFRANIAIYKVLWRFFSTQKQSSSNPTEKITPCGNKIFGHSALLGVKIGRNPFLGPQNHDFGQKMAF